MPEIDNSHRCAVCGAPVVMGTSPAAHWASAFSARIAAWTCSDECTEKYEAAR